MTGSNRQSTITALESSSCLADVRADAFPINSPNSKLQHLIFPEASQVCGFSMAETSCSQLMFCQDVFFSKPSQEKMHKYSQKQVTYFPADIHVVFHNFLFPLHTEAYCYTGSSLYEKMKLVQLRFFSQNLSKKFVWTLCCWRLECCDLVWSS